MLRNDKFSASVISSYLLIYCIFLQFDSTSGYAMGMLMSSPLLLIWMIYTILKHGKYSGKELGDEEFGYQDKDKNSLGVF